MNDLFKTVCLFLALSLLGSSCQDAQAIKLKQYQVQGRALYLLHCSACHQADGTGLAELYPPVARADYLMENVSRSICITKNGLAKEIMVNGKIYDLPMPANKELTSLQVAEIMTYITTEWGDRTKIITSKTVEKAYEECEDYSSNAF